MPSSRTRFYTVVPHTLSGPTRVRKLMQATYQPAHLELIGGREGFVSAFYSCATLLYRFGIGLGLGLGLELGSQGRVRARLP